MTGAPEFCSPASAISARPSAEKLRLSASNHLVSLPGPLKGYHWSRGSSQADRALSRRQPGNNFSRFWGWTWGEHDVSTDRRANA